MRASPTKFRRAEARFAQMFAPSQAINTKRLAAILRSGSCGKATKPVRSPAPDRDLLRDGDKRYQGEPFESAYQKWAYSGLSVGELDRHLHPLPASASDDIRDPDSACKLRHFPSRDGRSIWTVSRKRRVRPEVHFAVQFNWGLSAGGTRIQSWSENRKPTRHRLRREV